MRHLSPRTMIAALVIAASAVAFTTATNYPNVYSQTDRLASNAVTPDYKLLLNGQVAMKLTGSLNLFGTSTLHNWEMSAHQLSGSAQFTLSDKGQLTSVGALTFVLPVHNLKGDKDGMNDNAYDALKADKYKDIRFIMTAAAVEPKGGNNYTIRANGNLTIAGVTRPITLEVKTQVNDNGTVTCQGTYALKMSDFNIDRPSFMFGAMKTGNDLTLSYSLL